MEQNGHVYLKPQVIFEPLFNQWYAWTNLIAPATSAMYVANLHVKIMQSFITSPQVHIAALKNPAMLGGPFLNYGQDKVPAIQGLLDQTLQEHASALEFAEAVKNLDKILSEEANGGSLEPIYQKIPDILKGLVELNYDLNQQASLRFIEGLLYDSSLYNESSQSIALSLADRDERSFVFSTPRLASNGWLHLSVPFRSESLDELFKMASVPRRFEEISEMLKIGPDENERFSKLFTHVAPAPPPRYEGDDVRIRYFGHACILIESKETSLLCDPVISYDFASEVPRYTFADLPETIDYVLITHNHQDHCMFETLLQLRHKIKHVIVPKNNGGYLADPSMKLVLQNIGFADVREIDEMETIEIPNGSITGLPFFGEHADLNIRTKTAYVVKLNDRAIMCAADSENIEPKLYERISEALGAIDVVFIGMECDGAPLSWLYGPLLTKPLARKDDQSRRSNGSDYEKAMAIVDQLKPDQVYVYAMGQEPWLAYLTSIHYTEESRPIVESNKLVEECQRRGLASERLFGQKEIILNAR